MQGLLVVVLALSEIPTYNDGSPYGAGVLAACWLLYCWTLSPIPVWFCLYARAVYRKHGYTDIREVSSRRSPLCLCRLLAGAWPLVPEFLWHTLL